MSDELWVLFSFGKRMHTLDIEVNISARKKSANDIACIHIQKKKKDNSWHQSNNSMNPSIKISMTYIIFHINLGNFKHDPHDD